MADKEPVVFSREDREHLMRCIEMSITGYNRGQKVRPEFAEVANRIVADLTALRDKIKSIR